MKETRGGLKQRETINDPITDDGERSQLLS